MINESEIGMNVRHYRKTRRMTLQTMADLTGFSKGYLSKLEKSNSAPPLSTLTRIGKALRVTTSALLGESSIDRSVSLVKKAERINILRQGTIFGYSYESIAHKYTNRNMQPFILTMPLNPEKKASFQHDSEELLFVLKGTMKFKYGDEVFIVEEGDCIYFDGNTPHSGEATGDQELVCLMVLNDR